MQRLKSLMILASFLFWGLIPACTGGMGPAGNLGGPSEGAGNPPSAAPNVSAAAPGQQPTELGWGNENPAMVFIRVAKSDGTVDLATEIEIGLTCKTAQGDSSPAIFPGEVKPFVHPSYIMNPQGWPTNGCGQIAMGCDKSLGTISIFATFNDQGLTYQSDAVSVDCAHLSSAPVVLNLKPTSSNTVTDQLSPGDGSNATVNR